MRHRWLVLWEESRRLGRAWTMWTSTIMASIMRVLGAWRVVRSTLMLSIVLIMMMWRREWIASMWLVRMIRRHIPVWRLVVGPVSWGHVSISHRVGLVIRSRRMRLVHTTLRWRSVYHTSMRRSHVWLLHASCATSLAHALLMRLMLGDHHFFHLLNRHR